MHGNLDMSDVNLAAKTADGVSAARSFPVVTRRITRNALSHVLILSHSIVIVGCGVLTDLLLWRRSSFQPDFSEVSIASVAFYVLVSAVLGSHSAASSINVSIGYLRSAMAWLAAALLLVLVSFAVKGGGQYSQFGSAIFTLTALIAITTVNALASRLITVRLKKRSIAFARMQIVTLHARPTQFDSIWTPPPGIELTDRHSIPVSAPEFAERCREVRSILQRSVAQGCCDQILLAAAWQDTGHIAALLRELGPLPAPIVLLPDPEFVGLNQHRRTTFGRDIGFELQSAPLGFGARWAKRALDVLVAMVLIVFLSPVMLLAILAIWLETGSPILFCQDRRGFGGVPFKILKFRTMSVIENGADIQQAQRKDVRITVVGQILRRKSIDELPQLFNVLKGEMSLVGPRPHAMAHDDYYDRFIEHYAFRHHVKPGITGWAQVNGLRGATEAPELMRSRVEHDLWYINHWSIWLDAKIIFLTALKVFRDDNAY
ncbi:exopolysaccharide biosynthesis polyprenyl glycosylphosphotransferase [Rhizobium sp. SG570]|uniref:exopolysaccharide biosynthesis polyprenyl glycosylphosphotransferase n=1 Tax=Rhizobium sp. SG570 TaxID=2587113 RepID=UPI001446F6CF|nr:exopolysaccharide biosynthesis polyprenyl glycosylphosphotransferase [Rhizobium sp. SG570]NKJ40306.1 Undecaprenyl-phosphate glucose phosphotransferase [Rhizobium sp. SG570]